MRREYQILWLDDEESRLLSYQESVKTYLNSIGFELKVTVISQFSENAISKIEQELASINPYNLILVDHHLSDGREGVSFAKRLRNAVYTDIVYYSDADVEELREKLFREKVDGVHISNRQSLHEDVKCIIEDQVKRDFDAINMRGFVLDSLSQMEGLLRNKYAEYFQSLEENVREQKIQKMMQAIKSRQERLIERIEKSHNAGDICEMLNCTSLVTLDVVRDALKELMSEGERILGQESEFCDLQQGRNRWAHDSISLSEDGQRVLLSNDKKHPKGYGREEFAEMRVKLLKVSADIESALTALLFGCRIDGSSYGKTNGL